jgi:hypothetical protein
MSLGLTSLSETLYVEVGGKYCEVPSKGDLISIQVPGSAGKILGVCLSVDTRARVSMARAPKVKALIDGKIMCVPLSLVSIEDKHKKT